MGASFYHTEARGGANGVGILSVGNYESIRRFQLQNQRTFISQNPNKLYRSLMV